MVHGVCDYGFLFPGKLLSILLEVAYFLLPVNIITIVSIIYFLGGGLSLFYTLHVSDHYESFGD